MSLRSAPYIAKIYLSAVKVKRSFSTLWANVHPFDARAGATLREVESMRERPDLLLAELHAHSSWSDGQLPLPVLVDLYGRHGFDVLCITDHVHAPTDDWAHLGVPADRFGQYVDAVEREAHRALEQ